VPAQVGPPLHKTCQIAITATALLGSSCAKRPETPDVCVQLCSNFFSSTDAGYQKEQTGCIESCNSCRRACNIKTANVDSCQMACELTRRCGDVLNTYWANNDCYSASSKCKSELERCGVECYLQATLYCKTEMKAKRHDRAESGWVWFSKAPPNETCRGKCGYPDGGPYPNDLSVMQ
jgi:hypothetical protein